MRYTVALAIVFLPVFILSASGLVESAGHANLNSYFTCKHSHAKIERTKLCPCGCNKLKKSRPRLSASDSGCESDDVVAHTPQFIKLAAHGQTVFLPAANLQTRSFFPRFLTIQTFQSEPPTPPG